MRKKTKKKANKNDEIIQLLREILEELRKLNENTNNGNLEKGWKGVFPDNDSTANWRFPPVDFYITFN